MSAFSIPHLAPVRFVKALIDSDEKSASVKIGFDGIPTFGMLIEAAVQSSSGITDDENDTKMGFLVSLKNVKLLKEIDSDEYIVKVELIHKIDDFKSLSFQTLKEGAVVAKGMYSIVLQ